ncbi:MAG TPA: protein kinase [Gemmatimonadales bacterium]|jgi:HAMP domain-containing protein|nr:protein kinase [Gemmatimonadales bacterium]
MPSRLGQKIFLGTALVVVAVLGAALLVTKRQADSAADAASTRALQATQSAIGDALAGRSQTLRRLAAALAQVPAYVSRIGESLRAGTRANLLDQADELRAQTGADWVLITDGAGVLQAWTANRSAFDEDFSRGALIGRALEGQTTEGVWIEPGQAGDELYQAVGVPVVDPGSARPFGVVVAALRIDSAFARQLRRHTNSEIVFFARDTLGVPQVILSTLPLDQVQAAVRAIPADSAARESVTRFRLTTRGTRYEGATGLLATADGVPIGGYVGLHSRDADLAAYHQLSRTIGWAFVVGLVLALGVSVLMARQITRPVNRLVEVTRRVSEGQYTGRIEVTSRDEIGELATAFRRMVEELREKDRLVTYLRTGTHQIEDGPRTFGRGEGRLVVGARFAGRYDIQEAIGAGGMGVVYRAFDREVGETVAIKALRPELDQFDPTMLERFKQELRLARRITHRNVVRTFDIGELDGVYYITMEFVRGTTVATLIREAGRLAVPAALTIGKQVCRALEVAHEEGIVHRDIKPQNLLVDPTGFLKVMDFGIARLTERRSGGSETLTAAGVVVGTPQYMAPEQLFGEPVDHRSDLYATGAVLFECVTGRHVFEAPTPMALLARHMNDAAPDPIDLNPEIPAALAHIIAKALERRPENRWGSATDMLHALEQVEA